MQNLELIFISMEKTWESANCGQGRERRGGKEASGMEKGMEEEFSIG